MACELRTTVGGDVVRHSKTGNPVTIEGSGAGFCGSIWKWDGFRPSGEVGKVYEEVLYDLGSSRRPAESM